jgi:hypothetical protein
MSPATTGEEVAREVTVPLSEHEQRVIQSLEQMFIGQDPDLVQRVRAKSSLLSARSRLWLSAVGLLVGVGLIAGFCLTTSVVVGVLGYVIMFISVNTLWTTRSRLKKARLDDAGGTETGVNIAQGLLRSLRSHFGHAL